MPALAAPSKPRFEHFSSRHEVLGIGTGSPRISWIVPVAEPGYQQRAYELEILTGDAVSVVRVDSGEQLLVPWPITPLRSRESAQVRVRVSDGQAWSDWSDAAQVEVGLLAASDWSARFVSPVGIGLFGEPAPIVRGRIRIDSDVVKARLYATAHGIYVPSINGQRVSDEVLSPGWTSYANRLRYQTYDVTHLLQRGDNDLTALLGNGWYRGHLGWFKKPSHYGDRLALLAQLEVTTSDGRVHTLATDESWTATECAVTADDLYDGESIDLRRTAMPECAVETVPGDLDRLVAPEGPAVRPVAARPAERVWVSPSGRTLVDFGQNVVGWVRLQVRDLPAGTVVTLRHAEVLEDDELSTRPLRGAKATDTFILAGPEETTLEPSLTFHGFRYAEVSGVPDLRPDDLQAIVITSDLERTGWFDSSHAMLNRFHENVVWSMRGNFIDIPTDCPQRDERLGWTGDAQVFAPTASFLFDVSGFLGSWLADLAAEQAPSGAVPHVIPDIHYGVDSAAAAWGDAAVFIPYTLFQRFGDVEILRRQFASMCKWVDHVEQLAGPTRLWDKGFQFGDWLDPTSPPDQPAAAKADPSVVATAHFARSADLVARTAKILGNSERADHYARLAASVREAFASAYLTPTGRVVSEAQTVYALLLEWDLLPTAEQRQAVAAQLADLVRTSGFRISTGFVGTPLTTDALTDAGHADLAYRLLLQTECPSWLYPVTMGATTIWERWDSMLPDGAVNPGEMTSFNHYALGAVADWMHRTVAGLAPAAPGYRRIRVQPVLNAALTHASAKHITPYGEASVAWVRSEGALTLTVRVPVGCEADVYVPGSEGFETVAHGEHVWSVVDPVNTDVDVEHTLGQDLRAVMDQPLVWNAVVAAAADALAMPEADVRLARHMQRHLDAPASQLADVVALGRPSAVVDEFRSTLAAALRQL